MFDQHTVDTQLHLLQTHRQTLAVLLDQQAQLPAHAPPAVPIGIRNARAEIARIKGVLRGWNVPVADEPNDNAPPLETARINSFASSVPTQIGGDAIIANIGAGARDVVVGKGINITRDASTSAPDNAAITAQLGHLRNALNTLRPTLDAGIAMMADFQVQLLSGELSKPETEVPSASAVMQVGDWLWQQVPGLRPALGELLHTPAVLRALARAGQEAVRWAEQHRANASTL